MQTAGLIVAARRGLRSGGERPERHQAPGTTTALGRSISALLDHPAIGPIQVVIHPEDQASRHAATAAIDADRLRPFALGGDTRAASVLAGLEALASIAPDRVLIHDAARPIAPASVISAVLAALDLAPAACPAAPVVDALWRGANGFAQGAIDRAELWRVQTPQGFAFDAILAAHRANAADAADDVAVARAAGLAVRLVPGAEANDEITPADDVARARRDTEGAMDIRTGNGFDVHAFGPGDHVTLCGVRVPFGQGLVGHSDSDVGMHALTDAIFGALADGDIGQWFPPSDPQWKGAASQIFLRKAMALAAAGGFVVTHLDCTLVCEAPRIGPYAGAMRAALAEITALAPDRISVKATTSERLGFTGRGEGIAAIATATLVRP